MPSVTLQAPERTMGTAHGTATGRKEKEKEKAAVAVAPHPRHAAPPSAPGNRTPHTTTVPPPLPPERPALAAAAVESGPVSCEAGMQPACHNRGNTLRIACVGDS
eukprot:EG_transcript_40176